MRRNGRRRPSPEAQAGAWIAPLEPLEPRLLMAADCPIVESFVADNRGLIEIQIGQAVLDEAGLTRAGINVFTPGADLVFGGGDDVSEDFTVDYDPDTNILRIDADLEPDTGYAVILNSAVIRSVEGRPLDGEFNGADQPSGDGEIGGNFVAFARPAANPIARFSTSLGVIDVQLFPQTTPQSVENFLNYANDAEYDGVIFHRVVENFVIQGGGFGSEPPFPDLPADDPVVNEPFISNTRGTLAYAKLGGQPNSATNEWFFNLTDNSGNLDNQNGGFTVFGEITNEAGLAVMDAIAELMTVNAQSLNSAFSDLPVLDDAMFDGVNDLGAEDLVVVERVATLMQIGAEPFGQIDAESFTFTSDEGVRVTIYDLDAQIGLPGIQEHVRVNFGGGGTAVNSVVLTNRLDEGRVGIVIDGAQWVRNVVDQRAESDGVGFIVSDTSINRVMLRGDLTGFNINGLALGGDVLPTDIDADGRSDDLTGLYVQGQVWGATINGDVNGDFVAEEGVSRLVIRGEMTEADIVAGELENDRAMTNLILGALDDVSISVDTPIGTLRAYDWQDGGERDTLRAPSVRNLRITGNGRENLNGDFEADILLTGAEDNGVSMRTLFVRGDVNDVEIETPGDVYRMIIRGEASIVDATIFGDLRVLRTGAASTMNIRITGDSRFVNVDEWIGGEFIASTIRNFVVSGNRADNLDGDLAINLRAAADIQPDRSPNLRNIRVNGDVYQGIWDLGGDAGNIRIRGEARDMEFQIDRSLRLFRAGAVENSLLAAGNDISRIDVASWQDGGIEAGSVQRLTVTGDRRLDIDGDLVNVTISTSEIGRVFVTNDVVSSELRAARRASDPGFAIDRIIIKGQLESTDIRTLGRVNSIETGNMSFSGIYAGAPIDAQGFVDPADVDADAAIDRLRIRSLDRDVPAFQSSFVVAGAIDDLDFGEVEENNFGVPYGVAAFDIGSILYRAGPGGNGWGDIVRPFDRVVGQGEADLLFGDFQIRIDFATPMPDQIV